MFHVYLIQSETFPEQRYVGFTADSKKRMDAHNAGGSVHTSKYKPWRLISYHAFGDERRAREFEYYLKSGSGRAVANKRLWQADRPRRRCAATLLADFWGGVIIGCRPQFYAEGVRRYLGPPALAWYYISDTILIGYRYHTNSTRAR